MNFHTLSEAKKFINDTIYEKGYVSKSSHTFEMDELNIESYSAAIRTPDAQLTGVAGAVATFNVGDTEYGSIPGGYSAGDYALLIMPSTTAIPAVEGDNTTITGSANTIVAGVAGDLDFPIDSATKVAIEKAGATTFSLTIEGTSPVAYASVFSARYLSSISLTADRDRDATIVYEVWDWVANDWIELGTFTEQSTNAWIPNSYPYTAYKAVGDEIAGKDTIKSDTDAWKTRITITYTGVTATVIPSF
ncbi:hypothetical protein LCGC14_2654640, partial [marine sediment metagenome]